MVNDLFSDFFGHEKTVLNLRHCLSLVGSRPHAFLFSGPSEIGKRTLACRLAGEILQINSQKELERHPDFYDFSARQIEGEAEYGVSSARDLSSALSLSSASRLGKVVVLDEAESLTLAAANALLKTIEEPRSNTFFFFISSKPREIIETIQSRLSEFRFSLLTSLEMESVLSARGDLVRGNRENFLMLAGGRPGRLLRFLSEPDYFADFSGRYQLFLDFFRLNPMAFRRKVEENLSFSNLEPAELRQRLNFLLTDFIEFAAGALVSGQKSRFESYKLAKIADLLIQADKDLSANLNPRLVLENVLWLAHKIS